MDFSTQDDSLYLWDSEYLITCGKWWIFLGEICDFLFLQKIKIKKNHTKLGHIDPIFAQYILLHMIYVCTKF